MKTCYFVVAAETMLTKVPHGRRCIGPLPNERMKKGYYGNGGSNRKIKKGCVWCVGYSILIWSARASIFHMQWKGPPLYLEKHDIKNKYRCMFIGVYSTAFMLRGKR